MTAHPTVPARARGALRARKPKQPAKPPTGAEPGRTGKRRSALPAFMLSHRIMALVALAMVGQLALLGIYQFSYTTSRAADSRADRLILAKEAAANADADLARLREVQLVEAGMFGDGAIASIDRSEAAFTTHLGAAIDTMRSAGLDIEAAETQATVAEAAENLRQLARGYGELGVDEMSGLRNDLRAAALKIETQIRKVENTVLAFQAAGVKALGHKFLELRQDEKVYIHESQLGIQKKAFETTLLATRDQLRAAALLPEDYDTIDESLTVYEKAFKAYVARSEANSTHEVVVSGGLREARADLSEILETVNALRAGVSEEAKAMGERMHTIMLAAAAIGALTVFGLGLLIARSITRPLTALGARMRSLAEGDNTSEIAGRGRRDEIGTMATALAVFRDNAVEAGRLRAAEEARKADVEADRKAATRAVADELEASVAGVVNAVASTAAQLRQTAEAMSGRMATTGERASLANAAAGQTNSNVSAVAAAAEELSRSVEEIGTRAMRSSEIVRVAVAQASAANDEVDALAKAGTSIAEVVDLISTIAEQTNLLALNATIEASRAGDAGRGFTVVANEVKTLAGQTARATQDIAARIKAMRDATETATKAIHKINETVGEVDGITHTIAAAVEEQGATTRSISQNMHDAATGTEEVSAQMGVIDEGARTNLGAAQEVLASADALGQQAGELETRMTETLKRLRAA